MEECWYKDNPKDFEELKSRILDKYPELKFQTREEILYLSGKFPISFEDKKLEEFEIDVLVPKDRKELPSVWEIGGRIDPIPDNHINPFINTICLFVPDESWIHFPPGSDLLYFLDNPVRNYFLGISLHLRGHPWPFGERSHGAEGLIESYTELLGTSDVDIIRNYLEILAATTVDDGSSCPCKSGKILRDCHKDLVNDLRTKITTKVANQTLTQILSINKVSEL